MFIYMANYLLNMETTKNRFSLTKKIMKAVHAESIFSQEKLKPTSSKCEKIIGSREHTAQEIRRRAGTGCTLKDRKLLWLESENDFRLEILFAACFNTFKHKNFSLILMVMHKTKTKRTLSNPN